MSSGQLPPLDFDGPDWLAVGSAPVLLPGATAENKPPATGLHDSRYAK